MAEIIRGGQAGSSDDINISQGDFREQLATITDAVKQLSGGAEIAPGAVVNDPLNAPYVLYVNPYTGKDTFVSGSYSTSGTATERIELQRLECGYTEARPFKTVNRAVIEAGIITAKSYYTSPLSNNDLVSIIMMPGATTAYNGVGVGSVSEWANGKEPTAAELTQFNPTVTGGILLPRGVSLCGLDLRKTIFRPDYVPSVADEASDYSNRRAIFKVTGTGYYFGFTFMDKVGSTASHHLLSAFEFASESELDEFYSKITDAFGGANNTGGINNSLAVTKDVEFEIVGPQPAAGSQTINTDTTNSASPYIFNCSIRSNYGLCGIFANGDKVTGFKSMVTANYTAVSLQRDLNAWQKYSGSNWGAFTDYQDYIDTSPNDVRMNPARRSFHVRAVNKAVIQEVSLFAIGQGVHHWTESGGEITITNSNSNFGGCAAISKGYRDSSFTNDTDWNVARIKVATNLSDKLNNVRRIYLGTVSAVTSSSITLTNDLGESEKVSGQPDILARDGYTFRANSYVWVENPLGEDWRTTFTSSAWSPANADQLNVNAALSAADGTIPGTNAAGDDNAIGKRVYIRRLVDTRTPSERRYTLLLSNTGTARIPVRDYVLQTDITAVNIDSEFAEENTLVVASSGSATVSGVNLAAEVSLRRADAPVAWSNTVYWKKGDTVRRSNKHFTCIEANNDATFDPSKWSESYVHMPTDFNPEDFYKNEADIIVFDNDTSGNEDSTTLGYNLSTVWTTDSLIAGQYQRSTDYLALHLFLYGLGFSTAQATELLIPKPEADRELDPSNTTDMNNYTPSGAANALANWAVELRRPSVIRLFGHAWEWSGYLNYTKALPKYQQDLSEQNRFTYYFTNAKGGRVYASGFNQEGFRVSPQGLEDITTGKTLSVENLGASDITIDDPTELTNLTLRGTTTINDTLDLNANTTFGPQTTASTSKTGVVELATAEQLRGTSIVAGTTEAELNNNISQNPQVVTAKGLNYWARNAGVVTRRDETLTVYVVPDNAVQGNSYTFNGVTAVLDKDPNRTGSALSDITPEEKTRAVTLSRAAQYANSILSEFESATYVLANGPYYTSVTFNHIAHIYGSPTSFSTDVEIADYTTGATPNTNVKSLQDNLSVPCFATPIQVGVGSTNQRITFQANSTYMRFNKGGSINGICWVGTERTLADTSNFPDSIYSANIRSYRSANSTSLANLLNAFLADLSEPGYQLDKFYGWPCVYIKDDFKVKNTIFGAKSPGKGAVGYGRLGPSIFVEGDADLQLQGVYLLGTVRLESSDLPAIQTNSNVGIYNSGSEVYGERHSQCFIASRTSNARGVRLQIINPGTNTINQSGGNYERNLDSNCIHILDSNGNYGLMTNRANTTGLRGATFKEFIGQMATGSFIYSGGYSSTYGNFTVQGHHHGFAGVFGDDCGSTEKGNGPDSISDTLDPLFLYRFNSYHDSFFQVADPPGSSNSVENTITKSSGVTFPVNPGTRVAAWTDSESNSLNIYNYVYKRGIDVNTGNLVGGFGGTYFYL